MSRPRGDKDIAVFFVLVVMAFLCFGCGTADTTKVLSAVNERVYWHARYDEQCVQVPVVPPYCGRTFEALGKSKVAITEANEALNRGGKLRLQIRAMRRALDDLAASGVKP